VETQPAPTTAKVRAEDLKVFFGSKQALLGVSLDIPNRQVTAIIGPSGCGKSTLVRAMNRMHDLVPGASVQGRILLDGVDIYGPQINPVLLRQRVGMVFQRPNPFPTMSISENIAFAPRRHGVRDRDVLKELVRDALERAALWEEVAERLDAPATSLSGGQQQRLCIARALAVRPEVLLMDEPCSALDPIATTRIEDLIHTLKRDYTIVIVTHNMQQAARVSDRTAFMLMGELIEVDATNRIFTSPSDHRTEDYITGKFG